ncbi:kunitz-type trypsin inhibitor KTI1-like [Vigna unguiculata]|uniref:Kunitz inhibitor ST1-like n=1 Tax=Vigna unguiculata TaxID=3917 RepID=A0A4D6NH02_VIGUN|nr:kunitz-type trypsin inhibitor KTI1-like [Vigna unguiculata]QCE11207.1 Kunitz inhibitor ST1-like [Vigna unguiculata]
MKFTTFFSLFLLCAFTWNLPSASADVVDTDGNPLENSGTYFVRPVIITGNGGGVEFAATGNETCPLSVIQVSSPFANGIPILILSPEEKLYIEEGSLVDIGFSFVPLCSPYPSKWTAVKGLGDKLSIKLNGYDNIVAGKFTIKGRPPIIGGYRILFCPDDESSCGYVGIQFDDKRNRHLVVTQSQESALWIRFQRTAPALPATATASA